MFKSSPTHQCLYASCLESLSFTRFCLQLCFILYWSGVYVFHRRVLASCDISCSYAGPTWGTANVYKYSARALSIVLGMSVVWHTFIYIRLISLQLCLVCVWLSWRWWSYSSLSCWYGATRKPGSWPSAVVRLTKLTTLVALTLLRFNMKAVLPGITLRRSWDFVIFIRGISTLVRRYFILRRPRVSSTEQFITSYSTVNGGIKLLIDDYDTCFWHQCI